MRRPLAPAPTPTTSVEPHAASSSCSASSPHDDNVHLVRLAALPHGRPHVRRPRRCTSATPSCSWTSGRPRRCCELIERHRVTHSHMVPTQFHRLLALPEEVRASYDVSSLRHMIHAAAPCPPEIKRRMIEWWGPVIDEYYAATEGGGTLVTAEEWLRKPGTVGTAWPTPRSASSTTTATTLPTGEHRHRLHAHGRRRLRVLQGRGEDRGEPARPASSPSATSATSTRTATCSCCDRKTDMIISGGVNIYPAEIEGVLLAHPKVGDVAVFGIPHDGLGRGGQGGGRAGRRRRARRRRSTDELLAFCRDQLAKFKLPKSIDFIDRDAARPERQALQAQAPRPLLGGPRARDLTISPRADPRGRGRRGRAR